LPRDTQVQGQPDNTTLQTLMMNKGRKGQRPIWAAGRLTVPLQEMYLGLAFARCKKGSIFLRV